MSQDNYFIIDSFFSVKSTVQTYNKATIQPLRPQLSLQARKPVALATASSDLTYDTLHIKFPEYFTDSHNVHKAIEVEICRLFDMTSIDPYSGETGVELQASMHSDIWNINDSADHYICTTNTLYNNPKHYVIGDNRSVFEVWFYKPNGEVIDLDPSKTRAIIEFVLKY